MKRLTQKELNRYPTHLADFSSLDLSGLRVFHSVFIRSTFYKANMQKIIIDSDDRFKYTIFSECNFANANMRNAIFKCKDKSQLINCNIDKTILIGVDLTTIQFLDCYGTPIFNDNPDVNDTIIKMLNSSGNSIDLYI